MPTHRLLVPVAVATLALGCLVADSHGQPVGPAVGRGGAADPDDDRARLRAETARRDAALPPWFRELDADGDGQLSLREWRDGGRRVEDFGPFDPNGDGFATPDEVFDVLARGRELRPDGGPVTFGGTVETVPGEKYRDKAAYTLLTVELAAGTGYQFDLVSPAFQGCLMVESAAGDPLAEAVAGGVGGNCRLAYRATRTGRHRLVVTSAAGVRTGPFTLAVRAEPRRPSGPAWLRQADADRDGQLSLYEWRTAGRPVAEFHGRDLNGDGFLTPAEYDRGRTLDPDLKFTRGRAEFAGTLTETPDDPYRGKVSYTVLTVELLAGTTYHFDLVSRQFQAFLFLETAAGEALEENSARTVGDHSRLEYRAGRSGVFRVVATSLGGFRTGPFTLSVRAGGRAGGLPPWFEELDADRDGQISLYEWRTGGRKVEDYRPLDRNNDGHLTPEEAGLTVSAPPPLRFLKGRATHSGTVAAATGDPYRGKTAFAVMSVELEAGRTYHFEQASQSFQSFLVVEDGGEAVAEGGAGAIGEPCRLSYRAGRSGSHRVVATSVGGYRTGPFTLAVRAEGRYEGLPPWFEPLDADRDGQVSLFEWRTGGRPVAEFLPLDANGDGFVTSDELRRASTR